MRKRTVVAASLIAAVAIAGLAPASSASTTRTQTWSCVPSNTIDPVAEIQVEYVDTGTTVDVTRYRVLNSEVPAISADFQVYDPLLSTWDAENDYPVWYSDTWVAPVVPSNAPGAWRTITAPPLPYASILFNLKSSPLAAACTQGVLSWFITPVGLSDQAVSGFVTCVGASGAITTVQMDYRTRPSGVDLERWRFKSTTPIRHAKLDWTPFNGRYGSRIGSQWDTGLLTPGTWSEWGSLHFSGSFALSLQAFNSGGTDVCGASVGTFPNGVVDIDQDGLTDTAEAIYGTDPYARDTDGGGRSDGAEVLVDGTVPTVRLDDVMRSGFPNATNTGVPVGTALTPYTGPCVITTPGTVIDSKTVNCDLTIQTSGVVVSRSKINGSVTTTEGAVALGHSFALTDVEVDATPGFNAQKTAVGAANFTVTRSNIYGGNRSVNCWDTCTVTASFVHGQDYDVTGTWHESGIRLGQYGTIRGNTIVCDTADFPPDAGCSASVTGYPDFAPLRNNTLDANWFPLTTGAVCVYLGNTQGKPFSNHPDNATFITVTSNVFDGSNRAPGAPSWRGCGYSAFFTDYREHPTNVFDATNMFADGPTGPTYPI